MFSIRRQLMCSTDDPSYNIPDRDSEVSHLLPVTDPGTCVSFITDHHGPS